MIDDLNKCGKRFFPVLGSTALVLDSQITYSFGSVVREKWFGNWYEEVLLLKKFGICKTEDDCGIGRCLQM